MFPVNKNFTIKAYSKSDRCIYKVTLKHLKANRNINRISNWIWVFYKILHFYHLSRLSELYLKASVLR